MGTPEPVFGHLATQAYLTGLELGLFQRLARGPATGRALARAARANPRAVHMVLDALVGLDQLERRGERYHLPQCTQALLRCPGVDPDRYFDAMRDHLKLLLSDWNQLADVVRTGRPIVRMDTAAEGPALFAPLVYRLFPTNYLSAQELLRKLPKRFQAKPLSVLDVACGSACWSMPFAQANAGTRVEAVDFAPVLDVARHFAKSCGVEGQYIFRAGDIRRIRLGNAEHDVALLGHICHAEGEAHSKRLFRKVHKALRPGGLMLVADMIVDEKRLGEGTGAFALLFALNMLVHTERGDCFTASEYRAWAKAAGFRRFAGAIAVPGPSPILSFQK